MQLGILMNVVHGPLLAKRDRLRAQMLQVEGRMEEVKQKRMLLSSPTRHRWEFFVSLLDDVGECEVFLFPAPIS